MIGRFFTVRNGRSMLEGVQVNGTVIVLVLVALYAIVMGMD